MTPIDPKRIEILDPVMVRVWKSKSPAVRVDLALSTNRFVRDVAACGIRNRHPDWTADQVQAEVARRMAHGAG